MQASKAQQRQHLNNRSVFPGHVTLIRNVCVLKLQGLKRYMPHVNRQKQQVTRHTPHVTRHTLHVTPIITGNLCRTAVIIGLRVPVVSFKMFLSRVTCDVWRVTCDVWRVTCDVWRVTHCVANITQLPPSSISHPHATIVANSFASVPHQQSPAQQWIAFIGIKQDVGFNFRTAHYFLESGELVTLA